MPPAERASPFPTTEVEIRHQRIGADEELPATMLSEVERKRIDSFRSETRRRSFAAGRVVVRRLLGEILQIEPAAVRLRVAHDGSIQRVAGWHVALSHTMVAGDVVALAGASTRPLGIDVEAFKSRRSDLFRRILLPEEYDLLEVVSTSPDRAQVILWSLKEAVLKAERCGFRASPRDLRLELDPSAAIGTGRLREGRPWTVRWDERRDYVACLAHA